MTDKEKAIVMAHTGICMLAGEKFGVFHAYIEDILGRPVYTHELATQSISDEIKEKSRDDFIKLCMEEQEPKTGRWIYGEDNSGTGRDGWYCNQCGHFEFWDYSSDMKSAELNLPNLCPNCKAKMQEVEE